MINIGTSKEMNEFLVSSAQDVVKFPGDANLLLDDIDMSAESLAKIEDVITGSARRLHLD